MKKNTFKNLREERGLSQAKFSIISGISTPQLHLLEEGAISNPKRILEKLAQRGYDVQTIAKEYQEFRQQRQIELSLGKEREGNS